MSDRRREIDGLRAVAVLAVLAFHADRSLLPGGFAGVDAFFVISGYLITGILQASIKERTFSLHGFFERRLRRIVPALLVVLTATAVAGFLWLTPVGLQSHARLVGATLTLWSNVYLRHSTGYFGGAVDTMPLLHTWSLSVEEQFYLLYPLLVMAVARWMGMQRLPWLLASMLAASATWLLLGNDADAGRSFYLLQGRVCELSAGALAQCGRAWFSPRLQRFRQPLATTGLLILLTAFIGLDVEYSPIAWRWLWPTAGTVILLATATPDTFVGRLLARREAVALGLLSYSTYLWHQPLLAFARLQGLTTTDRWPALAVALSSIMLAWPTWRWIERPCRDISRVALRPLLFGCAAAAAGLLLLAMLCIKAEGFPGRFTPAQRQITAYESPGYIQRIYDEAYLRDRCFLRAQQSVAPFQQHCLPASGVKPSIMVWGDSHAAALAVGLRERWPDLVQLSAAGCPPLPGLSLPFRPNCRTTNDWVMDRLEHLAPRTVILHAQWSLYRRDAAVDVALRTSVAGVRLAAPQAMVVVVGPLPQWSNTLPKELLRRHLTLDAPRKVSVADAAGAHALDTALRTAAEAAGARYVSLLDDLCDGDGCLAVVGEGSAAAPLVWDADHLTLEGSRHVATRLDSRLMQWLSNGAWRSGGNGQMNAAPRSPQPGRSG